jgi:alkanesulfonate monooxygenase SsuD/methylene tetrahydromethanopterin reductase-like flavin-dependent oxidoreductase (luciferase family)
MRFGIFDHFEVRDEPVSERYENRLKMIEAADAAGFWCYHKAEHHFTVLDAAPSANLLFAAAAQRTERIRLGSLVYLLPLYDPLRLIEEICVLDQMTGGRLEVGVGKGISPVEHRLWGNDPDAARALFEEAFAVLRAGLAGGRLSHAGATRRYDDVPMLLSPYQEGGPGIWYPGNYAYAGAHRLSTIVGGPPESVAKAADVYRKLLADDPENWNPAVDEPTFGATMHLYVAPTDEQALERVGLAYPAYHRNLVSLWRAYDHPLEADPSLGGDEALARRVGALVAGSPETVAAHIETLRREADLDYVVSSFAWGDLSHAEAMDSLNLFAAEVIPRF